MIVLGGAPGVYQADLYPFIGREIALLEKRLAAGLPALGICLGAQMMAKALGASVYPGPQGKEIGWHNLHVNEAGRKTVARHLDGSHTSMMHWHGDTFDLPQGATLLASSETYQNQIFSWGRAALALQCHTEVDRTILRNWMVNAAGEDAAGNMDIQKIKDDTEQNLVMLNAQAGKFITEWLQQITAEGEKTVA